MGRFNKVKEKCIIRSEVQKHAWINNNYLEQIFKFLNVNVNNVLII